MTGSLDELQWPKKRKVWTNTKGTQLMTVSELLEEREYKISRTEREDGTVVLECKPKDC